MGDLMNCPRCERERHETAITQEKHCVCGYNFNAPEKSSIHVNERFIHGNTKTSHKSYESMVVYALHYALRDVEILSQHAVATHKKTYFIDAYIPALNLAIEVDEPHHNNQQAEDAERQKLIEAKLCCKFIRITCSQSLYEQVDKIAERVLALNLPNWLHKPKSLNIHSGEFKQNHIDELEAQNIPELMSILAEELEQEGSIVRQGSVFGIPSPSNGEIGFLIDRAGLTFAIYGRKTRRVNVRVLGIDDSVPKDFIRNFLNPRQVDQKKYGGPRYYALPDNGNSYPNRDIAKEMFYQLISKLENFE
jgi:very-short-patch-repair endonuclease